MDLHNFNYTPTTLGHKDEDKLHLGVREQRRVNTTVEDQNMKFHQNICSEYEAECPSFSYICSLQCNFAEHVPETRREVFMGIVTPMFYCNWIGLNEMDFHKMSTNPNNRLYETSSDINGSL
jgi:hypothetical protein